MSGLDVNTELLERLLVGFIQDEIYKVGFTRGIIALSGGIDSSTVTYLAKRALGPENVMAVIMPYKTSNPQSREDALVVVNELGINYRELEITPMIDSYFAIFPDADNIRRGNKMARERMTILYDQSVEWGALVIGTSNKTELLLGYGTLFGDMASAINPLGDIYKTQVRQLARHLGVPERIIGKKPSADLWLGQTDEGELGFTYEDVDRLLHLMVDERYSLDELIDAGFAENFVLKVHEKVRSSQYKRRLPVIAKVSKRTIDRDFRYARDWGR